MSIESIIGIVSGVIAIVGAIISIVRYLKKRKGCPTNDTNCLFFRTAEDEVSEHL